MNRPLVVINLIVIFSFGFVSCQVETAVIQTNNFQPAISPALVSAPVSVPAASPIPTPVEIRCRQPQPAYTAICQQWEEEALATTVRIQMSGWVASAEENTATWTRLETEMGHGTVKDGRYLITHNHYQMPFDLLAAGRITGLVSLFTSAGEPILSKADINIMRVAYEDSQTLVLDFQTETGEGLFDSLSIPSADFMIWTNLSLQPGQEVAQIDWDGTTAHVDWVEIQMVTTDGETPKLELNNFNAIGSSGGGVFWQGYHIANNWRRTTVNGSEETAVPNQFSSAALNSFPD